ncbi:hypothetical protein EMPS_00148 [Entomortierella parvispora]|uniref:Uncharacterized protein n=1 Tax=Entomortierella parvispora TaxID=205924 RepID=A0A9P3H157_9FUNG|nr:hypothetical protein EMPS_00148 [Entomortierella parvispora]
MKFSIASATVLVLSAIMTMASAAAAPAATNVLTDNVDEVPRCCVYGDQEICDGPYCAARAREALIASAKEELAAGVNPNPDCCVYNYRETCDRAFCAERAKEALAASAN